MATFTPNNNYQATFIKEVLDPSNKIIAFLTARKVGKTYGGMGALAALIYNTDRCKHGEGWVVSMDHPESRAAQLVFEKVFGWKGTGGAIVKHLKSEGAYLLYTGLMPDGKHHKPYYRVTFKSAENYQSFRGFAADFLLFDEAAFLAEEAFTETLPVLNTTGGPVLICTTPQGHNWVYELYQKSLGDPRIKFIRGATSYDNPYANKDYLDLLKSQMSAQLYKQEMEGEFTVSQGLIYDSFKLEHVFDPDTTKLPEGELIAGIDWGWEDPFVYLWILKTRGQDGGLHYWVLDEVYESHLTIPGMCDRIRKNPLEARVFGRYAPPDRPENKDAMYRAGKPCWSANTRDQAAGIFLLQSYFERGAIHISKKCKNGISELNNYCWNKKIADKPASHSIDHFCDALRYVISSEEASQTVAKLDCWVGHDDGRISVLKPDGTREFQLHEGSFSREQIKELTRANKWEQAIQKAVGAAKAIYGPGPLTPPPPLPPREVDDVDDEMSIPPKG